MSLGSKPAKKRLKVCNSNDKTKLCDKSNLSDYGLVAVHYSNDFDNYRAANRILTELKEKREFEAVHKLGKQDGRGGGKGGRGGGARARKRYTIAKGFGMVV